ncbi:arabinan endo-1,5-alpha-L-arabinosidase [Streptomonospora nanhaiensis]|uniref:arabinan endo-1,5-alpha-L-arabinosidase n=1 Tax=Streptomonospora nanhaiensis TaxID=1323731 RepID=UPI001C385034|nr:arabinan endo-1,5-alpha-L-arabinosidase [Streptomonospora nanhaiensis]MBV2363019.1 arabinan endo-1,5-alpha-L-arabinosidase [Streptomonospora nanhaiensis]
MSTTVPATGRAAAPSTPPPPRPRGGLLARAAALGAAALMVLTAAPAAAETAAPAAPAMAPTNVAVHDPALVTGGGGRDWYVFGTGDAAVADGNITVHRSSNGTDWRPAGHVWTTKPAWLAREVPGVTNLWAPEVYENDGTYYLYYSASTFGSNRSVIGLATNTTLDPSDPDYRWVDRGKVYESTTSSDFNAIDPGIVEDASGTPWMAFGSFWSGIRMVRLEWPSGKPAAGQGAPLRLAAGQPNGNAIEAPYIVHRAGYYYLFVSLGRCCAGLDSTYRIAVGRSTSVTGPYVDRAGTPMLQGGGTVIRAARGDSVAAGGQSLSLSRMAYHSYGPYGTPGDFRLEIDQIGWSGGWPAPMG